MADGNFHQFQSHWQSPREDLMAKFLPFVLCKETVEESITSPISIWFLFALSFAAVAQLDDHFFSINNKKWFAVRCHRPTTKRGIGRGTAYIDQDNVCLSVKGPVHRRFLANGSYQIKFSSCSLENWNKLTIATKFFSCHLSWWLHCLGNWW